MNKLIATVMACAILIGVSISPAKAAPIDPADYGYVVPGSIILENVSGSTFYDGPFDYWDASFGPDLLFDTFPISDPTDAFLAYDPLGLLLDSFNSTIYASIMSEVGQFFFDLGNVGYLFTIDASNQGVDFTSSTGVFDTDVQLSLEEFVPIPLPAPFLLLLGGLGSFALLKRRQRTIG